MISFLFFHFIFWIGLILLCIFKSIWLLCSADYRKERSTVAGLGVGVLDTCRSAPVQLMVECIRLWLSLLWFDIQTHLPLETLLNLKTKLQNREVTQLHVSSSFLPFCSVHFVSIVLCCVFPSTMSE